jgi:hypothetical protein
LTGEVTVGERIASASDENQWEILRKGLGRDLKLIAKAKK